MIKYWRPVAASLVCGALGFLGVQSSASGATPVKPSWDPGGTWTQTFSDGFVSSTNTLKASKWNAGWFGTGITGPVNDAENTCYSSSNVTVSGAYPGYLNLRLTKATHTCKGASRPLTGAHINSMGKFQFGPRAAVEYRAYFPKSADGGVANWPALWDNGSSWPDDGENDTAEGLSGQLCTYWHSASANDGSCHGKLTGWHKVGYKWGGGVIKWYYDGHLVHTQKTSVTSPHYLILQNTQGDYGGQTLTPATLKVDWVRVWK
jgi:beta-glucanase (GH16 family)